ncbi:amidohydrolase family protein [Henriciella marina]|uniref:Amidohydrolase family protein n=1 Tax=Henriciella marina TaxID=453851 RepID=A0ABT4LTH0_9PROT|nr:amidohydrolase family protein [Henriciella marina]MCZ4296459.1 amidohydrolase family protein [Henriciella marina]
MIAKLDAHLHVWTLARGDYTWLTPDLSEIYKDFSINDAWPEAEQAGVQRFILVQAAASAAETDFLLSLAAADKRVAGVVGWVDFQSETAADEVRRGAAQEGLVGVRPMIADRPDPRWILQDDITPALKAMSESGLVFDGHARPDLISVMTTLAQRYPDLSIVVNHAGKPPIASGDLNDWRADIKALSTCPNVSTKLSGLPTEAGDRTDDVSIGSVVEHIADCFGHERVLWGSDWPVLTMAASYADWAAQSERLIKRHFAGHEASVWRTNAERIYLKNSGGQLGQA